MFFCFFLSGLPRDTINNLIILSGQDTFWQFLFKTELSAYHPYNLLVILKLHDS